MDRVRFIAALFLVALLPAFLLAEEEQPARGRTSDGTAFRTSVDGTQIVDYIAELEVRNEELREQVNALDAQVRALKQQTCQKPAEEKLVEKTLVSQK